MKYIELAKTLASRHVMVIQKHVLFVIGADGLKVA